MLRRTSFLDRHQAEVAKPLHDPLADVAERLGEAALVQTEAGTTVHPFVVHCDVNGLSPRTGMVPPGQGYVFRPLSEELKAELKERLPGGPADLRPSVRLRNFWMPEGEFMLYEDDFGNVLRWGNPLELHLPAIYGSRNGWIVLHHRAPGCSRELADPSLEGYPLRLDGIEGLSNSEIVALHQQACRQYQACYPALAKVLAGYALAAERAAKVSERQARANTRGWRLLFDAAEQDLAELKRTCTYEGKGDYQACWWSRPHTGTFIHLAMAGTWDELLRRLREQSEANAKRAGTIPRNRVVYEAIDEVERDGADTVRMLLRVFSCHAERTIRVHLRVEPFGRLIVKIPSVLGEYKPSASALRACVAYDLMQIG